MYNIIAFQNQILPAWLCGVFLLWTRVDKQAEEKVSQEKAKIIEIQGKAPGGTGLSLIWIGDVLEHLGASFPVVVEHPYSVEEYQEAFQAVSYRAGIDSSLPLVDCILVGVVSSLQAYFLFICTVRCDSNLTGGCWFTTLFLNLGLTSIFLGFPAAFI